jgi:hypothetical protein
MQKQIAVSPAVYDRVRLMADAGHRTMGGTIAWMLDLLLQEKTYQVTKIEPLPCPPDAEPVPLVTVHEV